MSCSSCGKGKGRNGGTVNERTSMNTNLQEQYDSGNFVLAKYVGPSQTHNIGSPSGVIAQFGMGIYGRGRNGDIFLVHKDDAAAKYGKFTVLSGGTIGVAEKMLGLKPKAIEGAEVAVVTTPEAPVVVAAVEPIVELVENPVEEAALLTEALDELVAVANTNGTNDSPLKRSEALIMKEFVPRFGFTHQLQVMAKIKSGELKSYKNEEGKTMVYHVED